MLAIFYSTMRPSLLRIGARRCLSLVIEVNCVVFRCQFSASQTLYDGAKKELGLLARKLVESR
jgi:hypothetical protein